MTALQENARPAALRDREDDTWLRCWRRTYDGAGRASVDLDEGPGLIATQTLLFLSAGTEGLAAAVRRLRDRHARVRAGDRGLLWAGLAAHGG